jgi:hypothetical protein
MFRYLCVTVLALKDRAMRGMQLWDFCAGDAQQLAKQAGVQKIQLGRFHEAPAEVAGVRWLQCRQVVDLHFRES